MVASPRITVVNRETNELGAPSLTPEFSIIIIYIFYRLEEFERLDIARYPSIL